MLHLGSQQLVISGGITTTGGSGGIRLSTPSRNNWLAAVGFEATSDNNSRPRRSSWLETWITYGMSAMAFDRNV
ncbi:uncharacterized protein LOC142775872 isoform X4 [Rhipicephalus microplus]|uniref:uncharacterized protein LOC142775872 isoform X4 n=1 Tax=Rhipicephalus microplus TaxID=6941 RepID=UPI003F6BA582